MKKNWMARVVLGFSLLVLAADKCFGGEIKVSPPVISPGGVGVISYTLDKETDVTVNIHTAKDIYVRTLFSGIQEAGSHQIVWDGKDDEGEKVPSGEYRIEIKEGLKAILDTSFGSKGLVKGFLNPMAVSVGPKGNLYVAGSVWKKPTYQNWVWKFDPAGKPLNDFDGKNYFYLGTSGNAGMGIIDLDSSGNIYIAGNYHNIACFSPEGKLLHQIGGYDSKNPPSTPIPVGIAFGLNNRIYIKPFEYYSIRVYNRTQKGLGGFLYCGSHSGSAGWAFSSPPAMDSNGRGDIYCPDYKHGRNNTMVKYQDTGKDIERVYSLPNQSFNYATGCCWAGEMIIYVADRGNNRIVKVWDNGKILTTGWTFGKEGDDPARGEFKGIHDIAVAPDGKSIYVLEDTGTHKDKVKGSGRLMKFSLEYSATDTAKVKVD